MILFRKMRYLYFFSYFTIPYALHTFFRRIRILNAPNERLCRTFYAANHASSFMDPLLPTSLNKPIVHFMTRADIYKGFLKHIFHNVHMLPIFRQHDGDGHLAKNEEVFKTVAKEVDAGKSILVFTEGFTDDVFVRRLKPIKKGILRMAFQSLETLDWKEDVFVQTLGINYTHPKHFGTEVLMSYGPKILLNDYKEAYLENPSKLMQDLSNSIEADMQAQITYVEDIERCEFHENIMRLTRRGMNHESSDFSIPLEERWRYSQNLAHWLNDQSQDSIEALDTQMKDYFSSMSATPIRENDVFEFAETAKLSNTKALLFNIFMAPIALLGLIYGWISWFIIKPKVEKAFKRDVFWSSVKVVASHFGNMVYFLLLLIPLYLFVYPSILVWLLAFIVSSGPSFILFHRWVTNYQNIKRRRKIALSDLRDFADRRKVLVEEINLFLPNSL